VPHCDPETLALEAVGEPAGTPEDRSHLQTCEQCRRELADLTSAARVARTLTIEDHHRPAVAEGVWSSILAEIPELADPVDPPAPAVPGVATARSRTTAARRRKPRRAWLIAAVVAGVVGLGVGAAGSWAVQRSASVQASDVLRADLRPLDSPAAHGTAAIRAVGQAHELRVQLAGAGVPGRFLEVWLADSAAKRMVAIGVLDSRQQGSFTIPAALDLGTYTLVDVSAQAYDGNPAHSSVSVARGQLRP
jgi:hypothetical protein